MSDVLELALLLAAILVALLVASATAGYLAAWLAARAVSYLGRSTEVPDEATPELAARIDGRPLACGCPRDGRLTAGCMACGWTSCLPHAGAAHLCEPPADPIDAWLNQTPHEGHLKPRNLDDSAAEPNELLTEIYDYLGRRGQ